MYTYLSSFSHYNLPKSPLRLLGKWASRKSTVQTLVILIIFKKWAIPWPLFLYFCLFNTVDST